MAALTICTEKIRSKNDISNPGFDEFDDDDFDASVLETSISKTQPHDQIRVPNEWDEPMETGFETREYPLAKSQMEQYLRTKGLPDLYQWQKDCLRIRSVIEGKNLVFALTPFFKGRAGIRKELLCHTYRKKVKIKKNVKIKIQSRDHKLLE